MDLGIIFFFSLDCIFVISFEHLWFWLINVNLVETVIRIKEIMICPLYSLYLCFLQHWVAINMMYSANMLPFFIITPDIVLGILYLYYNLYSNLARIESAIDAEGEKEDHDHHHDHHDHDHHHNHDEEHDHKHGKSILSLKSILILTALC